MSLVVRRYAIALQGVCLQSYVSFNDLHKHKINWEFLFLLWLQQAYTNINLHRSTSNQLAYYKFLVDTEDSNVILQGINDMSYACHFFKIDFLTWDQ
jgi:hypothetical protein